MTSFERHVVTEAKKVFTCAMPDLLGMLSLAEGMDVRIQGQVEQKRPALVGRHCYRRVHDDDCMPLREH